MSVDLEKKPVPVEGQLSCSSQFGKMAIYLVNCKQYQTNKLNPVKVQSSIYILKGNKVGSTYDIQIGE